MKRERKEELRKKHDHGKNFAPLPVPVMFHECEACELLAALDVAEAEVGDERVTESESQSHTDDEGFPTEMAVMRRHLKAAREVVEAARKTHKWDGPGPGPSGCEFCSSLKRYDKEKG